MNIVIVNALGNRTVDRCLKSLYGTIEQTECSFDLYVLRELEFREETLNRALGIVPPGEDILFVGDDIVFRSGWFEALKKGREHYDIVGMSMVYPDSDIIQDRGYDLVQDTHRVYLEPRDRGKLLRDVKPFESRQVDAVCGCFLYVSSKVLHEVRSFSEKGRNRWGEFVYICEARKMGFRAGVMGAYLEHGGISTKSNKNIELRSKSYHYEKEIWRDIVRTYVQSDWVQQKREYSVDKSLISNLEKTPGRVLVYGVGIIAEEIMRSLNNESIDIEFCSGLEEEEGMVFWGKKVLKAKASDYDRFDWIIVTPGNIARSLSKEIHENLLDRSVENTRVSYVIRDETEGGFQYCVIDV